MYSSTCFERPDAHHQELNNYSSSLWFYRSSVVVAVLLVVVGPAGPTTNNSTATAWWASSGYEAQCLQLSLWGCANYISEIRRQSEIFYFLKDSPFIIVCPYYSAVQHWFKKKAWVTNSYLHSSTDSFQSLSSQACAGKATSLNKLIRKLYMQATITIFQTHFYSPFITIFPRQLSQCNNCDWINVHK
jgi:hypothetical protein